MSPNSSEYDQGLALGRIEQKVDELKTGAELRDAKLDKLEDRSHKTANAVQNVSSQVTGLQKSSVETTSSISALDKRVAALEAPVRKALQQRQQRRQLWTRIVGVSATVASIIWFLAEPIWKLVSEEIVRHFMLKPPP